MDDDLRPPPHALGMEKSVLSTLLQNQASMAQALAEGLEKETFYLPSHRILFEVLRELFLDKQSNELVGLVQLLLDRGLLDRIGGPAALGDLYTYAPSPGHFSQHIQGIKDKALLRQVIEYSREQIETAFGAPAEVAELVGLVEERSHALRQLHETGTSRRKSHVVDASSIREKSRNYMQGDHNLGGDGFFLPDFALAFRKKEMTLWFGPSGHGKSETVQNQVASLAARGRKTFMASFEQPAEVTYSKILLAMTAYPDIAHSPEFDPAYDYLTNMVRMYDSMERTSPRMLINAFRKAWLEEGIDTFVIDNVMTMNVDRDNFGAQATAIDLIRNFVNDHPVHLHLVAHPRKPSEDTSKPPTIADIRGAAEWGDMPNNVVVVWRDVMKGERIAEMEAANMDPLLIHNFFNSTPCGKIIVRKQRSTGDWPMTDVFFDKRTKRFLHKPGNALPMFSSPPWETP